VRYHSRTSAAAPAVSGVAMDVPDNTLIA